MFSWDEYQNWVMTKVKKDFASQREACACQLIGLAGETGELLDMCKKQLFHDKPLDREALVKEIGDVLFYLAAVSSLALIPLGEAMTENVRKLNLRYPNGFDPNRAHAAGSVPAESVGAGTSGRSAGTSSEWPKSAGE